MSEQYRSREERKKAAKPQKKAAPKKQKNGSPLWKKIVLTILAAGVLFLLAGGIAFGVMVAGAPPLDKKKLSADYSSSVFDKDNKKIFDIGKDERREYVPYDKIPKVVENAFLATEDARFYQHNGVDFIRLGGAALANFKEGFGAEGGSTITQQVVKNYLLSHEKTMKRKVQELWLSFQLERQYSKQQILELYLNGIYFTGNNYGIGKAAEAFYGKDVKDLSLPEAAMLAGMPKAPNTYNPRTNPEKAKQRRDTVLSLMAKHGFITESQAKEAEQTGIADDLVTPKKESNPYISLADQIAEEVKSKTGLDPAKAGLKIYTTIDTKAQEKVKSVLSGEDIDLPESKYFQSGIVITDTQTGEIRAIGPNVDKKSDEVNYFNYATQGKRQPGSTVKPILDYGPAVEYLKWSTYHQIVDEPYHYSSGQEFSNYDRSYKGQMSIRDALADSRNVPAVKTLQEVGTEKAKTFANGLGMGLKNVYESSALGTFESSPLKMAGAYSAFGNNGIYIEPHTVREIEYQDGTKENLRPEPKVAMSDYTAFMVTDMLKSVVKYGTGQSAAIPGVNVAGKTGTTNFREEEKRKYNIPAGSSRDAWFVGYTPKLTAAIWTGYDGDKKHPYLTKSEQKIARKMFKSIMTDLSDGDSSDFKKPKSVVEASVLKGSNPPELAPAYAPKDQIANEYFVRGTEPTKEAESYQQPEQPDTEQTAVEKPGGLSVNYDAAANAVSLSWSYNEAAKQGVTFVVSQSTDNGPYQIISTTKETSAAVSGVAPGSTYRYQVIAVSDANSAEKSDPASAAITIPGGNESQQPGTPGQGEGGTGDQGGTGGTGDQGGNDGQGGTGGEDGQGGTGGGTGDQGGTGGGTGDQGGTGGGTGDQGGTGGGTGGQGGTGGGTGGQGGTGGGTGGQGGTGGGTGGQGGTGGGTGDQGGTGTDGGTTRGQGGTGGTGGKTNQTPPPKNR